ncbi:transporter suffix domain-containing protein [Mariprofundus ferrooxydans]|nr:transporter suffix domain-containing protein [Mariprofundus ferrooxydans]
MKRMLGLCLFWLSWLLWGLVLLVPLVSDADLETIAVRTTALIVVSEVCFAVSIFLLGRPFYAAIKMRVKSVWRGWKESSDKV